MNILVIGGTGAFGARLCVLLARDGHDVTIASRTKPAPVRRTKQRIGGKSFVQNDQNTPDLSDFTHREFNRNGPLTGFDTFDVIVDAAGPFHAYGDNPYRIARAAIAAGAHYFDLSDNADFCHRISILDDVSRAAGVSVFSGMSSVPAISSAAVDALRDGQAPVSIDSAILPGNKAPRGRSVVESILTQAGRFYKLKQGGKDVLVRSWSDPRTYDLGGFTRQAWRIEVPDQRLFPDHFNCQTVSFRAGLELGVMRYGLAAFFIVRNRLGFSVPSWLVSSFMLGARGLSVFGTDRGGMVVDVVVPQDAGFVRKTWKMRALDGDGPFVPGIAVRAACRMLNDLDRGAKPALSVIPLSAIEQGFSDLLIETEAIETKEEPIFEQVLDDGFKTLPAAVRATHHGVGVRHFAGRASVARGAGVQARIAAALFGFPRRQMTSTSPSPNPPQRRAKHGPAVLGPLFSNRICARNGAA